MLAVLQAFTVIIIVIVVGAIVGRRGVLGDNARMVLNRTAFHIGVPALLLVSLADAQLNQVFSEALLVSAIGALVIYALYYLIGTVVRWPRGDATVGAMLASVVNAGNLGIPISAYVLGSTAEVSALILFQTMVIVPISIGLLDSDAAQRVSVSRRIGALFTNPIIAASAAGLVLATADIAIPQVLRDPLELLAALAVPTVLLAFGISLTARGTESGTTNRAQLTVAVLFKLVVMPAAVYGLARFGFGADQRELLVVTVLAALPSAQNINTYAALYGRGEKLARDGTLISTLLAVPVILLVVLLTG